MQQDWFTQGEARLTAEWQRVYQGTFKVKIEQIEFDPPRHRNLDKRVLGQLEQVFRNGQCKRLDAENHIPAIVARHDLQVALGQAGVLQTVPMSDPDLKLLLHFNPGELRGLHGRHRIQAASKVLSSGDSWWTVDLYLNGIVVFLALRRCPLVTHIG